MESSRRRRNSRDFDLWPEFGPTCRPYPTVAAGLVGGR
jgi:hypothetical protein